MVNIPGANLLKAANRLISYPTVQYFKFVSRLENELGLWVTTFETPINIKGSFQAIPRSLYSQYDLDLDKNYATFYTSNDILDVERDVSGDQIMYTGKKYQCESNNDWFAMDGWKGVLVIQVSN